jgi:hypothetical protein
MDSDTKRQIKQMSTTFMYRSRSAVLTELEQKIAENEAFNGLSGQKHIEKFDLQEVIHILEIYTDLRPSYITDNFETVKNMILKLSLAMKGYKTDDDTFNILIKCIEKYSDNEKVKIYLHKL